MTHPIPSTGLMQKSPGIAVILTVCLLVFWYVPSGDAAEYLRVPRFFGDHMVWQRDMPGPIWGWSKPGDSVAVEFAGQHRAGKADADGKWKIVLDPVRATATPQSLVVEDRAVDEKLTIEDVLVGEVWLCSGQSNMEWGVGMEDNGAEVIAAANHPDLRLFHVAWDMIYVPGSDLRAVNTVALEPQKMTVERREAKANVWRHCTPDTIANIGWNGFSAAAYFFGCDIKERLHVPVGLISAAHGGSGIKPFIPLPGFDLAPTLRPVGAQFEKFVQNHPEPKGWYPTVFYNSMIHPMQGLAIRGVLWHQGETDVHPIKDSSLPYLEDLKALIGGWRQGWGEGAFPFYSVTTGPYRYWKEDELPQHWMSQFASLSIPHTGLVVTTDIGRPWDLHPHDKETVGHRLALWALARTYGIKDIVYSGPAFRSSTVENDAIRLSFDSVGGGLASKDGKELTHFEIAGADQRFVPATARIDGATVIVRSADIATPAEVRFAWTWHNPPPPQAVVGPNLVNREGLPALPFNTVYFRESPAEVFHSSDKDAK